jgi:hypothetical protein
MAVITVIYHVGTKMSAIRSEKAPFYRILECLLQEFSVKLQGFSFFLKEPG